MSGCLECARLQAAAGMARNDVWDAKKKVRRYGAEYADTLTRYLGYEAETQARFEQHCVEQHDGTPDLRSITSRLSKRTTKPIPEGKVACHACSRIVSVLHEMRLRKHNTPDGDPCPNMSLPGARIVVEVPPVKPNAHHEAEKGKCRECGKWLPGERSLCGRCSVLQGRAS